MKLTVKKYKSCRGPDGDAFSCTLFVDGVKVAEVTNSGRGGENRYFDLSREMETQLRAWVQTLPERLLDEKYPEFGAVKPNLDIVVEDAIEEMFLDKRLRGWCKKKTILRFPTDKPGVYKQLLRPYDPSLDELIMKHNPGAEIVNKRFLTA